MDAVVFRLGQRVPRVVLEMGLAVFLVLRQRDPGLDAEHLPLGVPDFVAGAFGVDDAATGRHPVDVARTYRLLVAEAVPVHDLAVEEVGDRGQPDMRVRAHVDPLAGLEGIRSHPVEEDEGTDHPPLGIGQHARDLEASEVPGARVDHEFYGT